MGSGVDYHFCCIVERDGMGGAAVDIGVWVVSIRTQEKMVDERL
jgi:hypothetical protein